MVTCKSDTSQKRFTKNTGVRWSELLRLPYFDPIKFIVVDPMHCLFLGIARWIVKRIWVDEGILNQQSLIKIQKKWMSFRFHPIWAEYQKKSTAEKDFQTLLRTNGGYFLQYTLRFHSGAIFQNMIEKFFIIL
jgi:hypothetical protein